MSEVLESLADSVTFTTLDALSRFWQVELEESSKEKTAFSTRMGHYHFNVQPFGLKDARKFRKTSHDSVIGASRKPRPSLPS